MKMRHDSNAARPEATPNSTLGGTTCCVGRARRRPEDQTLRGDGLAENVMSAREIGLVHALQVRTGVSWRPQVLWVSRTGGRPPNTQRSPQASIANGTG